MSVVAAAFLSQDRRRAGHFYVNPLVFVGRTERDALSAMYAALSWLGVRIAKFETYGSPQSDARKGAEFKT